MKTRITNANLIAILATCGIIFLAGDATAETDNTKSLLSAAGFHARTPKTAKQKELYASLPSDKIEKATYKGKVFCVCKDEKAGVVYTGGKKEHQRYQQLCAQQRVAQMPEEEMHQPFAEQWYNEWGGGRE